jgi:hypothetical protein
MISETNLVSYSEPLLRPSSSSPACRMIAAPDSSSSSFLTMVEWSLARSRLRGLSVCKLDRMQQSWYLLDPQTVRLEPRDRARLLHSRHWRRWNRKNYKTTRLQLLEYPWLPEADQLVRSWRCSADRHWPAVKTASSVDLAILLLLLQYRRLHQTSC